MSLTLAGVLLIAGAATRPAPELVSYETLAKPLDEILTDVGGMVGRKVICSRELSEDRLCIYVTDVDPNELLTKIGNAVVGKWVEDGTVLRLVADGTYEKRLLSQRNLKIDQWHRKWVEELSSLVVVSRKEVDLSALAEFITPALLKARPLAEVKWYSRPRTQGIALLPSSFSQFHEQFEHPRYGYVGTDVIVQSTRSGIRLSLSLRATDGRSYFAYTKWFWMNENRRDSLILKNRPFDARLSGMMSQFGVQHLSSGGKSMGPTQGLEGFVGRPWGEEPLNAIAGPYLLLAARELDRDLVAFLDDRSIGENSGSRLSGGTFLKSTYVVDDGSWTVATALNPTRSRKDRADRDRLTVFLESTKKRGYFTPWALVEYLEKPQALPYAPLFIEAAALGEAAMLSFTSMNRIQAGGVYNALRKDTRAWSSLLAGDPVLVESLDARTRDKLFDYVSAMSSISLSKTVKKTIDGFERSTIESKSSTPRQLGFMAGLPRGTTFTIRASSSKALMGIHRKRGYLAVRSLSSYVQTLARAREGKGGDDASAIWALDEFVPCTQGQFSMKISIGESSFQGPYFTYLTPIDGAGWRSRDSLPKEYLAEIDRVQTLQSRP